jgi:asparagine synthase (glutamine-hydrolysing)
VARRLAIIDLTGGDQPIANEDGSVVVVQNGEIYNYRELAHSLARAGHSFHTRSDTEVLVHGYEEWGEGLWERLRGMFAVALWDARRGRLTLARDRFGIKPLYYRDQGGELSFASELDALPHGDVDLQAVEAFLSFNVVPAPLSIFSDIRKLLPGHTLTWELGTSTFTRFARPGPLPARHDEDEAELVEECRARLRDSVRAHLIADVPVGVLLSGGVDSGALAALAAEESSEAVRTFSIGFEEASFDELAGARAVSARYGTRHRELVLRPDAALLLPALAQAFDEPFADSSALPTYLVSELAAEDVKVALSGEGGDELFGGYYTYVADQLAERVGPLASLARPLVERLPTSTRRVSFEYKAKRFAQAAHLPPLERHHGWKEIFSADARAELTGSSNSFDPLTTHRARFAETEGHELLTRLQDVDLGLYLVDDLLTKTDRASMAWSLEARVPFMDTVVANFAFSLPVRHKVRGLSKKRLLRQAVLPLLPREVVHGRKRGFSIPAAAWLRGELEPFAREILSPETIRRQGFLQPAAVTRVLDDHVAGRADLSRQLWGLLAFTLWHEHHVEGVRRDAPLASVVA